MWQGVLANVTVSADIPQATLSALLPAFSYHLRVIANNSIGVSPPSSVVTATTLEEGRNRGEHSGRRAKEKVVCIKWLVCVTKRVAFLAVDTL